MLVEMSPSMVRVTLEPTSRTRILDEKHPDSARRASARPLRERYCLESVILMYGALLGQGVYHDACMESFCSTGFLGRPEIGFVL